MTYVDPDLAPDKNGFVTIRAVSNGVRMQNQYCSRYFTGICDTPILTDGLRVKLDGYGNGGDYYEIRIHQDDVIKLV